MDNKYQELFQSLSFQKEFRPAVHLHYTQIDDYASKLLSGILSRDIYSESKRSDFYDWSIKFYDDSVTETELEILYNVLGANEYDREMQSYEAEGVDSINELCQRISNRLFSKIMPFEVAMSIADDDGVWFLGGMTEIAVLKNNTEQTVPE